MVNCCDDRFILLLDRRIRMGGWVAIRAIERGGAATAGTACPGPTDSSECFAASTAKYARSAIRCGIYSVIATQRARACLFWPGRGRARAAEHRGLRQEPGRRSHTP